MPVEKQENKFQKRRRRDMSVDFTNMPRLRRFETYFPVFLPICHAYGVLNFQTKSLFFKKNKAAPMIRDGFLFLKQKVFNFDTPQYLVDFQRFTQAFQQSFL